MSTGRLRPWTDLVKLHPDVEGGALTEAVFAASRVLECPAEGHRTRGDGGNLRVYQRITAGAGLGWKVPGRPGQGGGRKDACRRRGGLRIRVRHGSCGRSRGRRDSGSGIYSRRTAGSRAGAKCPDTSRPNRHGSDAAGRARGLTSERRTSEVQGHEGPGLQGVSRHRQSGGQVRRQQGHRQCRGIVFGRIRSFVASERGRRASGRGGYRADAGGRFGTEVGG